MDQRPTTLLCTAAAAAAALVLVRQRAAAAAEARSGGEIGGGAGATTAVLRLGSRKSDLAMVQSRWVRDLLERAHPGLRVEICPGLSSHGDNVLNKSLQELAKTSPGLFTKELEAGLQLDAYDVVVHSLKDMPTTLPQGLTLAAITEREDPRDALVVHAKHRGKGGLAGLPPGSVVGTSSVRREAIIRRSHPHLEVKVIRGNVNLRLAKLDRGDYDAIVLALSGLRRLGPEFAARVEVPLGPPEFMYGVGQGALGIQCRADDARVVALLQAAVHVPSSRRCRAERALLRALEGGCQVPLAVHSTHVSGPGGLEGEGGLLTLRCQVLSVDGRQCVERELSAPAGENPEALGRRLADELRANGAAELLASFGAEPAAVNVSAAPRRSITYGSAEEPQRA